MTKLQNSKFSILGDSYSTFAGWIPEGQDIYYPNPASVSDVLAVEETWWHQLMCRNSMRLLINDSWSGSTVCTQVRETQPPEAAFVKRMHHTMTSAGVDGEKPDVIFLFGCTNDSWIDREVGDVQYCCRTEADLAGVLPAFCEMVSFVKNENPQAVIAAVINDELKPALQEGMRKAGEYYGIVTVSLAGVEKQNGHPNKKGMAQIADQIEKVFASL